MFERNTFLYFMFHVFGFIATIIYSVIVFKKFKLPFVKTLLFVLTVFPIAYAFMWFQYWVESGFKAWGNNIVRTFIWVLSKEIKEAFQMWKMLMPTDFFQTETYCVQRLCEVPRL